MNSISNYRQPIVTATGIFLGFVLEFATSWGTSTLSKNTFREVVIGTGLATCIVVLIVVLYRILNMNYPKHDEDFYYRKTLRLFIIGISIPFTALLIIMFEKVLT